MDAISRMTQDVINMHQLSQGVIEHFEGYVQGMNRTVQANDEVCRKMTELIL